MLPAMLDLASLRDLYAGGTCPRDLAEALAARMAAAEDPAIFIQAVDRAGLLAQAADLVVRAPTPNSLPLWGVPFAVKDNIDVAGMPTTAGCPAYAYTPAEDAFVVARLKAAGALVIGKTNLDQFATGLNGTRSPYGAPRCVFDRRYISGGSSSGSAVAVAAGLASFALGTDTAGSGRVPAALNNIVGIKPTPGAVGASGLVPACRSVDVITIFAGCVADGIAIRRIAEGIDPADAFSREGSARPFQKNPRVGVLRPEDREFYGDESAAALYERAVGRLADLGVETRPFDFGPFREAAILLYGGPWVAERLAALEAFLASNAEDFEPSVRQIVEGGKRFSAVDAFRGRYALEALRRQTEATWEACDALLLPTCPTTYTVEAMQADPIALNSTLGHYTNFANLLDYAAIAIPAGFRPDGPALGVTLIGPAWSDDELAPLADRLHAATDCGMGQTKAPIRSHVVEPAYDRAADRLELAVVGAHLSGLPLNPQLLAAGGQFVRATRTREDYRLFALPDTTPPKPGLVRDPDFRGPGIEAEVWSFDHSGFAAIVAAIPSPLGIGRIEMVDGSCVSGFLCEAYAARAAPDVSMFGGWRAYLASA